MSDILKKNYVVTMPDGSRWAVPVKLIAQSRAEYYADMNFDGDMEKSMKEDTLPLFESDPHAIENWARNNMDWADVRAQAVQVLPPSNEVDWDEGWANGKVEIVDEP